MYKCCWNCGNSCPAACKTREEQDRLRASKRFCCASYPVSNRLENPFKQRYCKQFEPPFAFHPSYPEITKQEADKLQQMTVDELVKYWQNKTECTDEAIEAVRDYMIQECLGGISCEKAHSAGYAWKLKDGRNVELTVSVKTEMEVSE